MKGQDIHLSQPQNATLSIEDAMQLRQAVSFLLRIRMDLRLVRLAFHLQSHDS